jgi:hypothetical protein
MEGFANRDLRSLMLFLKCSLSVFSFGFGIQLVKHIAKSCEQVQKDDYKNGGCHNDDDMHQISRMIRLSLVINVT